MLGKIFGVEGGFSNIMGKFADIVLLNILWIVCCLPIVTCASSSAALYYSVVKGIRKERGTPTKEFLRFFRSNWKKGIAVSVLYIAAAFLVILNCIAVRGMGNTSVPGVFYQAEALWVVILFVFLSVFLFPVFSRFDYRHVECMKTSLFISVRHTLSSIIMAFVLGFAVLLTARYPVLVFVLPGIVELIFSFRIERIFKKYMQKPEEGAEVPWYWE